MKYEMKASRFAGEYVVESIGKDGEVYATTFSGPDAEQQAKEYAVWKTEHTEQRIKGMEAALDLVQDKLTELRKEIDAEIAKLKEGHGTTS